MLKRITTLAMALSVASVVLPGTASAEWLHHNTPIQQNTEIVLTGNVRFQGGLGGTECQVKGSVQLAPGTGGSGQAPAPHPTSSTTNCKGLGGLAFCQVHNVNLGTGWIPHPSEEGGIKRVQITTENGENQTTGGFCPMKRTTLTEGSILATPNQPNTISSLQLSGTLAADIETNAGTVDKENVTISGTLSVLNPNANTYSL